MAVKNRKDITLVSALCGRIEMSVAQGKPGDSDYIPKTEGFVIEVTYNDTSDMMYHALSNSVVATQRVFKQFFTQNKRWPVAPGKVQKVRGDGTFDLPNTVIFDRAEERLRKGEASLEEKVRMAQALGLDVPQEWLDQLGLGQNGHVGKTLQGETSEGEVPQYKYNENELIQLKSTKAGQTRLRRFAQDEQLEGYAELSLDDIIEELTLIEN